MLQVRRPLLRLGWLAALPLLLAAGLLLADVSSADAATITVNSTGNTQAPDGFCTLIEAIVNANSNAQFHPDCAAGQGGGTVDVIAFQIPTFSDFGCNPGTRVCTIATNTFYSVVDPVTIDGYTQTNTSPNTLAVGNNAVIRIRLVPTTAGVPTGLRVAADNVTIRGLAIGGYAEYGIYVDAGTNARIVGCFIGTDAAGATAVPNGLAGVRVDSPSTATVIGGTSPADRSVISGNTAPGIFLDGSSGATIQGNYVGLKANGIDVLPNHLGILALNSPGTVIGGPTPGARNVISGNLGQGIVLSADFSGTVTANVVRGNYVGLTAAGVAGSTPNVIGIDVGSSGNTIGGTAVGDGNVIFSNLSDGVRVFNGTGNRILGNLIRVNTDRGIDLAPNGNPGPTPNDGGDGDGGPNRLQNFPVLTSVGVRVNTTVHGTLNSTPGRSYRIEFFSSESCDPSGFGEGETFLGFLNVTTDGSGNASFVGVFAPVPAGRFITSTATDLTTNDTSEFSLCHGAQQTGFFVVTYSSPTTEANEGGAFDARYGVFLSTAPSANVTVPVSISDPTEGSLVTTSTLTFTPTSAADKRVHVLGVDDGIDDGDVPYTIILGQATSADPNYNGLNPPDVAVTNVDDDNITAQCGPRPKVNVSVVKTGTGQLRATVSVTANPNVQNEIRSIAWTRFDTATVVVDGVGPVQQGQTTTFATPLTQSASFVITRTPGAQSGTVRLTLTDACGAWPTFVGGGPKAW